MNEGEALGYAYLLDGKFEGEQDQKGVG